MFCATESNTLVFNRKTGRNEADGYGTSTAPELATRTKSKKVAII